MKFFRIIPICLCLFISIACSSTKTLSTADGILKDSFFQMVVPGVEEAKTQLYLHLEFEEGVLQKYKAVKIQDDKLYPLKPENLKQQILAASFQLSRTKIAFNKIELIPIDGRKTPTVILENVKNAEDIYMP